MADLLPARTKRMRVMIEIDPDSAHVHVSELSMGRWNRVSSPDAGDAKVQMVLDAMLKLELFLNCA